MVRKFKRLQKFGDILVLVGRVLCVGGEDWQIAKVEPAYPAWPKKLSSKTHMVPHLAFIPTTKKHSRYAACSIVSI